MSAVGIERKDSRGDTASVLAESSPNLSQLKYLEVGSALLWGEEERLTFRDGP